MPITKSYTFQLLFKILKNRDISILQIINNGTYVKQSLEYIHATNFKALI